MAKSTILTRHRSGDGARWAAGGAYLPRELTLSLLLQMSLAEIRDTLGANRGQEPAEGELLAPIEDRQEVWAAGVTFLKSREARVTEAEAKDIYEKVYGAERVEVFFKAIGWRVRGHGQAVRIRRDSRWNVPEPELTLVVNHAGEIVGYTAGNDMSSRDIEGENPLYLPQAKVYDGSCAIGPGIVVAPADAQRDLAIGLRIARGGRTVFEGETRTSRLKRSLEEMVGWLTRELAVPEGILLMTGTGIVPPDEFTLEPGDTVTVTVGELALENRIES